jgi:hypothetical protein
MNAIKFKTAVKAAFVAAAMFAAPAAAAFVSAPSADAAAGTSILMPGEQLSAGQSLVNGQYTMAMQTDGNFVLYAGNQSLWQSGTSGNPNAWVIMQTDGNLVVYSPGPTDVHALWQSGTSNQPGDRLVVQPDGNAVIYNSSYTSAPWATNTNARPSQQLAFFDDTAGPLVHSIFVQGPNQNGIATTMCVATPAHTTIPSNWWWSARSYVYTYYSNNCTGQQVTPRLWIDIDGHTPYRCLSDVPPYSDWSCAASFTTGAVKVADQACADVALLTVRGAGEQANQAPQVDLAASTLASSLPMTSTYRVISVPYQAAPIDFGSAAALYNSIKALDPSISQGIATVHNVVGQLVANCPKQQIVLIGFSEGSAVVDLSLAGLQQQVDAATNKPLGDWVTHVTLLADPLRMPGHGIDQSIAPSVWPANIPPLTTDTQASYEAGPGVIPFWLGTGLGENIPEPFTEQLQGWSRTVSWCVFGDMVCDFPGAKLDLTLHGTYTQQNIQIAAATAARVHVIANLDRFRRGGP